MTRQSAGILLFRRDGAEIEVLIAHPGGPLWANKDEGAWSLPKGEFTDEDPQTAARREFREEMGTDLVGELIPLGSIRQKSGKIVHAWAVEADFDVSAHRSNTFEMEWPPKSGRRAEFPEIDRVGWFGVETARTKLNPAQAAFLDVLCNDLRSPRAPLAPGRAPRRL